LSSSLVTLIGSGALFGVALALSIQGVFGLSLKQLVSSHTRLRQLHEDLSFLRASFSTTSLLIVSAALLLVGALLCLFQAWIGLLLLGGALLPFFLSGPLRRKRVARLESQIEGWLSALARALESSPSLGEALEVSASVCDAPLSEELEVVINELRLGRPLDVALRAWSKRVESRTLSLALTTLLVGRQTGGRLPQVLKTAAASLREMERLDGVVRTKTAEGKAQTWVISAIPGPLIVAVHFSNPDYFRPFETTMAGHLLAALAAVLWLCAAFSARKILAVQI
jgi:tight adherence protein B